MPRIYTSANSPLDFCQKCFPKEIESFKFYGNMGDGPDQRGNCFSYDAEHPNYEEENYCCTKCKTKLLELDNHKIWHSLTNRK